ncbi:MerR family transcriptional regulator [Devosia sp. A16]|uniref:MerR family transcriptional regulator n=1 Tax=Devosia sp. A16 TaxID=1736675 RepID=UPI0006D7E567|nr:MerR family transcriptional regulator [Devosia sp. A16]
MKTLTVAEVAKLSGVSIRTLHHYDQIGLLRPAFTGHNRYRHYGQEQLLRLQQILLHRELGIPLSDIAAILDAPDFDRLAALRRQRERLNQEAKRYARLVRTIDRTIASIEGECVMKNEDLYKGVSPDKQAEYEAWLVEQYGGDMPERIALSRGRYEKLSEAEKLELNRELHDMEQGLAEGLRRGVPMGSPTLDPLLNRHRMWVSQMWGRPCPPEAYAGLADLYLQHPNFVARYETIEPGFAQYLSGSMKLHAKRRG